MNEPKLRFKADDGSQFPDWEEKKLGDITSQYKVRNKKRLPLEIYSVNNIVGFIPQSEQFDDAGYLKDTDTSIYMIVPPRHFAYNPARLDISSIGYQYLDHDVQVSSLYEVFETSDLVNDEFLWSWFHTHYFNNVVKRLQEGGVRLYFYYDKMQEVKIGLPSLPEQQKIAEFLSTIDTVIEKQKETVSAWEERKKGVMQKLFSQEVRFKADDGSEFPDWEEKKLGDVFVEQTERAKGGEALLSVTIAQGIVRQSETDKRNIASENKSNYKVVKKNDLAYNTMRMWQGAEGVSEYDGIVSPAYTVVTALDGNNSYFFETIFKQKFMLQMFQRYSQGLTSDTWNLKFPAFSEIKCFVPCEDEQNKIVECVHVFDDVIEKQKATLAAWEEMKKGLLQQMFV